MRHMDLNNYVAVVTGGSKGYGFGIAEALKKRGVKVWVTGRDKAALGSAEQKLGVRTIQADVAKSEDWDEVFKVVLKSSGGKLDILVNNAGAGVAILPTEKQTDANIQEAIAVNLTGAILGCRRAAPVMRNQKSGTIINISSVCAREAWPNWAIYSAAKAGLVHFSKCLYNELRPARVRVTSVIPSWGATEFCKAAHVEEERDNAQCIQPLELGELVADICSLPAHLEIQDITIWPLIQQVIPL